MGVGKAQFSPRQPPLYCRKMQGWCRAVVVQAGALQVSPHGMPALPEHHKEMGVSIPVDTAEPHSFLLLPLGLASAPKGLQKVATPFLC